MVSVDHALTDFFCVPASPDPVVVLSFGNHPGVLAGGTGEFEAFGGHLGFEGVGHVERDVFRREALPVPGSEVGLREQAHVLLPVKAHGNRVRVLFFKRQPFMVGFVLRGRRAHCLCGSSFGSVDWDGRHKS